MKLKTAMKTETKYTRGWGNLAIEVETVRITNDEQDLIDILLLTGAVQ